ncbi:hypothetical protein [Yersinia intermedia]|uniref:hypothetical protein n=1 Tax=Yersinia intermedia TaxID=631 RepID=UPI000B6E381F|nr:hypothetical protein [Yersinia intermedia]MCW8114241.1 hypothetical protein [Yersinia intermedia]MDA5519005.1 hypothetical protein [Yersinia intermedia]OWF86382.1 hypothetical protein B4916_22830 [Yersinia intermedia]
MERPAVFNAVVQKLPDKPKQNRVLNMAPDLLIEDMFIDVGVIAFDVGATDTLSQLTTQSLVDALNALFAALMPRDMFALGMGWQDVLQQYRQASEHQSVRHSVAGGAGVFVCSSESADAKCRRRPENADGI